MNTYFVLCKTVITQEIEVTASDKEQAIESATIDFRSQDLDADSVEIIKVEVSTRKEI